MQRSNFYWLLLTSKCTYDVDELRQFELDADPQHVRRIDDRPHEFVVIRQQIVVEALGVRITGDRAMDDQSRQQPHTKCFPERRGHPGTRNARSSSSPS